MIKSIKGVATRFFKENKMIAFTSIIGVMISISLIITMVLFISNAKQSLIKEIEEMYGTMDVAVGYNPAQELVLDSSLHEQLRKQDGVKETSSVFLTHYVVDHVSEMYYTAGVENNGLAKSRYKFTKDIKENEVSLNKGLATLFGVKEGDVLSIETNEFKVKEVLADLEAAGHVADILLLNREQVVQLELNETGSDKQADFMMFEIDETADVYEMAQAFQNIDPAFRVDIAVEDDFMKSNLDLLYQFVIGLSVLVIMITSLFLISNFELFLYKYKHELAILRSIGASKSQVFQIIFLQSSIITVLGGICAMLFSAIIYRYLQSGFEKIFTLTVDTMNFQLPIALTITGICMGIIQLFMLIPAYRSSRLLPITIMQENEAIDFSHSRLRKKIGFILLGFGALLVVMGLLNYDFRVNIVFGSIVVLISSISLIPLYLSGFMSSLLPIVRKLFGNISFVSLKNTIPQVRKNTSIILILSMMMIIVVFGSTFVQTIGQNGESFIKKQYETEVMIKNRLASTSNLDSLEFQEAVRQLDHVKSVSTQSEGELIEIKFKGETFNANYTFVDFEGMKNQGLLDTNVKNTDGLILEEAYANEHGLKIGDQLEISVEFDYELQTFSQSASVIIADIVKEFPYSSWSRELVIDWKNRAIDTGFKSFQLAFVEVDHPVLALEGLEELKGVYPEIQVDSLEQSLQQSKEMFSQRWIIFVIVLVVILLSVMFGVVNTLINNMNSKRKEFAVLRAIYMKPKNIVQVVMTQVTTYIFLGVFFGTLLGLLFTYLISLIDQDILLSFNFTLIGFMSVVVFAIAYVVLVPFANHLGKLTISEELMQEHR